MKFHELEQWIVDAVREGGVAGFGSDVEWLRSSQKFYFGDIRGIPVLSGKDWTNFPNLPFRECSFQFDVTSEAADYGALNAVLPCESWIVLAKEDGRLVTFSVWHRLKLPDISMRARWISAGRWILNRDSSERDGVVDVAQWSEFEFDKDFIRRACEQGLEKADAAIGVLASALTVMNTCTNLATETVEAPAALNKKRVRNGKLPIYSYKVLVIKRGAQSVRLGGSASSPRVHLVRGHIKRRKTGNFWWQPFARGDKSKGVVMKDYRADKLLRDRRRAEDNLLAEVPAAVMRAPQDQIAELRKGFSALVAELKGVQDELLERVINDRDAALGKRVRALLKRHGIHADEVSVNDLYAFVRGRVDAGDPQMLELSGKIYEMAKDSLYGRSDGDIVH